MSRRAPIAQKPSAAGCILHPRTARDAVVLAGVPDHDKVNYGGDVTGWTYAPESKDIRTHLNGILWIARSGARWSDLPARFGPHQTVYSCFCRWRDDGTLKKIFELCAAPGTGTELSMDSTSIKASAQAGRGIRKRAKLRHQTASAKHAEVRTRKFMPLSEKTCGLWLFCCLPEMLTIARRRFLC